MIGKDARADTDADNQIAPINRQGRLERLDDREPRPPDVLQIGGVSDDDCKFIAAQARREADFPCRVLQAMRKTDQDTVAKGVSHAVIQILEIIDIEEKYADQTALSSRPNNRGVEQHEKFPPVR